MGSQKESSPETPREKQTLRKAMRPIVVWLDMATGRRIRNEARKALDLHLERAEETEKKKS